MSERLLSPKKVQEMLDISRGMSYSKRLQEALGAVKILGVLRYPESRVLEAQKHGAHLEDQEDAR